VNVEIWRCLAEICQESVKKGKLVDDETHLKKNIYEDKGEARSFTKVVTQFTQFLSDRRASNTSFEKVNVSVL
jgi:single-stranded DNA-binding protein